MAWGSKGRSGYGDRHIGGDYDDWSGLSTNGRQYKNPVTLETRDLSGADYWHTRKANNYSELCRAIPDHFNADGTANIKAYREPEKQKTSQKELAQETLLEYSVFPEQKALDKIEELIRQAERLYLDLVIDDQQYDEILDNLDQKYYKAWVKLCKAKGWTKQSLGIDQKTSTSKLISWIKEKILK